MQNFILTTNNKLTFAPGKSIVISHETYLKKVFENLETAQTNALIVSFYEFLAEIHRYIEIISDIGDENRNIYIVLKSNNDLSVKLVENTIITICKYYNVEYKILQSFD